MPNMQRRDFLAASAVLPWTAGFEAQLTLRLAAAGVPAHKLNLLVIHTDEHNFRTLGCYRALLPPEAARVWGKEAVLETPHIDSLAKDGALCTRFYAASPVCTPSRASFVTGRYPQNTGAVVNDRPMLDDMVTFAEVLRRQGYATGYAGKWHLDGEAKPGWSPRRKFGFDDNRYMFNRGHWKMLEDTPEGPRVKAVDKQGQPTYAVEGADAQSFTTDFLADKTIEFIRAHRNEPFCFMLSIPDPHGPNTVRPPYDTMFADIPFQQPASAAEKGHDLPSWALPAGQPQMENMPRYFGMVKCIDDNVGKILAALREAGLWERTIVVFTSDHGDLCGEHGRINKGNPLQTSACVPFLIRCPGLIAPATVVHEALTTADFKPTILGLMGAAGDAADEGRDASCLLRTGKAPSDWQDAAFSYQAAGLWLMAVSRRWKLVFSVADDPCLFDLDNDPLEMTNCFRDPQHREEVRRLAVQLLDYARRFNNPAIANASLHADLVWAAEGAGPYVAPKRPRASSAEPESGVEVEPKTKVPAKRAARKRKAK